ncbi:MAG: SOS response-associated peptidase [Planctomycetota bacterium]
MCGRFTLTTSPVAFASLFDGIEFPEVVPRYNIAPTQDVLTIRVADDGRQIAPLMRWGLVPFWAKDLKIGARMINARGETVAEKPSFRNAFKSRRCLIPLDGFYEWKRDGKEKWPHYITRSDDQPFFAAGLWEKWKPKEQPDADPIYSCTIITTDANETMQPLHDRMPVILDQADFEMWTDPEFHERSTLEKLLAPCPAEDLKTVAVSKTVNKATNEVPGCIVPLADG